MPSLTASVSLLVCICFLLWPIFDAQYRMTLYFVRLHVGLEAIEVDPAFVASGLWDVMWDSIRGWDRLGPRLGLYFVLSLTGFVSSLIALAQIARFVTIRRLLLGVLLCAAWISLYTSHSSIQHWSVERHARRAVPRFKTAASALLQKWPTQKGVLPEAGKYYAYPEDYPNLLLLQNRPPYPLHEDFGYSIERSEKGALRFGLYGAFDANLELHPIGSLPTSYTNSFGNDSILLESIPLDETGWFFVRYRS